VAPLKSVDILFNKKEAHNENHETTKQRIDFGEGGGYHMLKVNEIRSHRSLIIIHCSLFIDSYYKWKQH
jgi:hypothetical protein